MAKKRRAITIQSHDDINIDWKALKKITQYFYRGTNNISIKFRYGLGCYGKCWYEEESNMHYIEIDIEWVQFNTTWTKTSFKKKERKHKLSKLSNKDMIARVLNTLLHEIRHCIQHDINPDSREDDARHPDIRNSALSYELSPIEADAESWSLKNIDKAILKYWEFKNYE